jgi:hypothetical protein
MKTSKAKIPAKNKVVVKDLKPIKASKVKGGISNEPVYRNILKKDLSGGPQSLLGGSITKPTANIQINTR